ncbi:hypothetical protein [Algoriphagus sp. AK58]|uniref:hypothetical protein n=1 Tax=Algoriphagus sp. AK58 TaxID=1406877 RepID=UPI001650170C|nr:hypothetical protein [Algoriphagus sp. AK58]
MKKTLLILLVLLAFANLGIAQESASEGHRPKIRAAILMANSRVPHSYEGEKKLLILPTWGMDVDYFFHPRWSVAFQADIKVQSFEVEKNEASLERSYPVALAGVIHFHALRHWSFYAGPGYELEKSENLFLVKLGTEYSFEITEDFEIALNLAYENKNEVYDSWTFGVAFNKKIWEKK